MQDTMLDSTISQLLQDKSAVEYVAPEKNPVATVQSNELIFGQKHKDIDCALCPTAKRACDRAWVTAKQVENWSKMSKTTLWRWLERLEKARRIASVSDMKQTYIQDSFGAPHETTLYNLNVLNQLAMVCIDNFSDCAIHPLIQRTFPKPLDFSRGFFFFSKTSWCCFRYTIQPVL